MGETTTSEAQNETPADPNGNAPNDDITEKSDLPFGDNLAYIIGGSAILCIIVALIVAVVLWRKHPRRSASCHINSDPEKGGNSDVTTQKPKQKTEIEIKTAVTNNQQPPGIELVAFDAAPDIITAHDSDSIYETLDGRRAARARAANNSNSNSNSSNNSSAQNSPVVSGGRAVARVVDDVIGDPTYDHLGRFLKNPRTRATAAHPGHPVPVNKRFTDPEVSFRRPSVPAHFSPREVRSAGGFVGTDRKGVGGGGRANELERRPYRGTSAASAAGFSTSDHHRHNNNNSNNNNNGRTMGMCKSCISSTASPSAAAATVATNSPSRSGSPSLSSARRTSLAEMALQNSSGGKRIVCQLTMVGVVENGKQVVPVSPQPAAGSSYFILEPPTRSSSSPGTVGDAPDDDAAHAAEDVVLQPAHGWAKVRIRKGAPRDGDSGNEGDAGNAGTDGSGGGGSGSKSEYFLLEPLDQQDDFTELALSSPSSVEGEREEWSLATDLTGGGRDHHHHDVCDNAHDRRRAFSHSREPIRRAGVEDEHEEEGEGEGSDAERRPWHGQSFRNSRLRSCPDACDSADTSPTLPPRNKLTYKRSLSSPISSFNHRHHQPFRRYHHHHYQRPDGEEDDDSDDEWDYPVWGRQEKKMDADVLKERIQRELRKFGWLNDDPEPPAKVDVDEDREGDDDAESYNNNNNSNSNNSIDFVARPDPRPRPPPKNEYFILEPQPDTFDDSDSDFGVLRIRPNENNNIPGPVSGPSLLYDSPANHPGTENVPPPPPPGGVGTTTTAAPAPAGGGPDERPRYQRHYATPALPPRNTARHPNRFARGHNRSKSETPLDLQQPGNEGAQCGRRKFFVEKEVDRRKGKGQDPEEGPVVVSLKSVKRSKSGEGDHVGDQGDESFRPRLKSESGVLSERKTKT